MTAREHPILFSAPMVRAILEGRKTQTRRVVKPQPEQGTDCPYHVGAGEERRARRCPYGVPGDRLWLKEPWRTASVANDQDAPRDLCRVRDIILYDADLKAPLHPAIGKWRSPIHMPRWASRITLEVTGVRVERVQDINLRDVMAEGTTLSQPMVTIEYGVEAEARLCYAELWDSIHGGGSWDENPFVWCVEFRRITP